MSQPELIAAIPTYNSSEMALKIGASLLEHGVPQVILLDDASREDEVEKLHTADQVEGMAVSFGKKNIGPGRNRNRVLPYLKGASRDHSVLFVDADMELVYEDDVAELVQDSFIDQGTGAVGYRILNLDGTRFKSNFGPLMSPWRLGWNAAFRLLLEKRAIQKEAVIEHAPLLAMTEGFIDPADQIETGGVAEGCFAIRSNVFKYIKGFDSQMRYHEAHDLHARLRQAGFKTMFNPTRLVRHLEFSSRGDRRMEDDMQGIFMYFEKHWNLSQNDVIRLLDPNILH